MCNNGSSLPSILFESFLVGAFVHPVDTIFSINDVKKMFAITKPKLIFCDSGFHDTVKAALSEQNHDALIITVEKKVEGVTFIEDLLKPTGSEHSYE